MKILPGDKLRLLYDIYDDCFNVDIIFRKGDIVDVIQVDVDKIYVDNIGNLYRIDNLNSVEKLFKVPEYVQTLPTTPGLYLYTIDNSKNPLYCKLDFYKDKLCIMFEDTVGTPIVDMTDYWWLRVF